MKSLVSAAALAIGLAAAGTAAAAPAQGDAGPSPRQVGMIKAMDTDGDGKVSKAEFLAFQPKGRHAVAADANVTREEFMKRGPQRGERHAHAHAHAGKGDQKPADRAARREERRAEMFKAFDKDGNGSISREEFMAFEGPRMGQPRHHRVSAERMQERRAEAFKRLDANNDGVLSPAERQASREAMFTRLDRNGDGFVTADELPRRGARPAR